MININLKNVVLLIPNIISTQDLHAALKMLGVNPTDQEVVDIPNNIAR